MLHAIANETVMGRVVCPRRIDPFAAELQLPERLPRGRWALPAPTDRPRTPEPPRPLELEVLHVEPAVAAPGGPLRIRVRLDARVAEEDLVVTIGGAVRPSFRLSDRRPAADVDGAVDGAAGPAAADASSAASSADCALISVLAPVLHARGPWAVQLHAHGASSEPTPAAELRLRLPRRPESAAARAAARTAARAAAHAAAHAEAPGSPPRCRGAHEHEASRVGGGELHPAPLSPHAAAAAAGTEADEGATEASGSLAAAGTQMLAAGRPPPLLLRGTREEHLAQAAALYTRERQERTSTALILTLTPALALALNLTTLTRAVALAVALFLSPALSLALTLARSRRSTVRTRRRRPGRRSST